MKKYSCLIIIFFITAFILVIESDFSTAITVEQKVQLLLTRAEQFSKKIGDHEAALKLCHEAIKLQPGNLESYYRRAFIYGRRGDYANAINDFSLVIKHDGKNQKRRYPSARKFRANCFMGLVGYLQKAVDDYSVLLKRNSKSG